MKKLVKKIKLETTLEVITGLHIGDNSENVEIGGIDNGVIKLASKDNQPYIPGSSLKGKIRCLLEQEAGVSDVGGNDAVNNLFGITEDKKKNRPNMPSKIIVRDAMLTEESKESLKACENLDMPFTENKWENVIKRKEGTAEHPRQTERVPAGAVFNVEFVINVWDNEEDQLLSLFRKGIRLLENDYLGGSGSRGYGQIRFGKFVRTDYTAENQWNGDNGTEYESIQDI